MKASKYFMTREWSFDNDVMKSVYARYAYTAMENFDIYFNFLNFHF